MRHPSVAILLCCVDQWNQHFAAMLVAICIALDRLLLADP
jgi:hypothetical protein